MMLRFPSRSGPNPRPRGSLPALPSVQTIFSPLSWGNCLPCVSLRCPRPAGWSPVGSQGDTLWGNLIRHPLLKTLMTFPQIENSIWGSFHDSQGFTHVTWPWPSLQTQLHSFFTMSSPPWFPSTLQSITCLLLDTFSVPSTQKRFPRMSHLADSLKALLTCHVAKEPFLMATALDYLSTSVNKVKSQSINLSSPPNRVLVWAAGVNSFFLFNKFIYLFIYFWLCWVFVSVRGLSLVAASGGHSSSRCTGLSLSRPLLLRSTGSRRAGSVVVAHGSSCSAACGIFPDQRSNPCPLHWQADSQPLRHQGSPVILN